jgi:hypothetical protein
MKRDRSPTQIDEALEGFRTIQSKDIKERREAISKELIFIGKKWGEMNQEKLEMKMKMEYDAYEHDVKFEEFRNEKDLILAIELSDFRLKLENVISEMR